MKRNECPWDGNTCWAALHGNLENMIWLKKNECPWNARTYNEAVR